MIGPPLVKVCSECGSDDIVADAFAQWDKEQQRWTVAAIMDSGHSCNACGADGDDMEIVNAYEYTVFVTAADRVTTSFVTRVNAKDAATAASLAIDECAEAWGEERESLGVLGIIEGAVNIQEWRDYE